MIGKQESESSMSYEAWQLGAMEEAGYMDTSIGLINRVARYLSNSPNEVIEPEVFRNACISCGVDPDSFTQGDLDQLRKTLNRL